MFGKLWNGTGSAQAAEINQQLKQGEALEKNGDIKAALDVYENLLKQNPGCKACKAHMALAKTALGKANDTAPKTPPNAGPSPR